MTETRLKCQGIECLHTALAGARRGRRWSPRNSKRPHAVPVITVWTCPKALKTKPKKKRGRGSDPGCLLICVTDNFFTPTFLQPLFFFFVSEARQCHTCAWGHGPCQEPHGATSLYSPQLLHLTSPTSHICSGRRGCCAAVAAIAAAATAAAAAAAAAAAVGASLVAGCGAGQTGCA